MSDQLNIFDDVTLAQEEAEVFGPDLRPAQLRLDGEGDFIHGYVVNVDRGVDLKTGFPPVDIWHIQALGGVHKGRSERIQRGRVYAWPVLHATAKNRLEAIDPQPADGERIAVRRERDFRSTQGESEGKMLAGYLVKMPDRPEVATPLPTEAKTTKDTKAKEAPAS